MGYRHTIAALNILVGGCHGCGVAENATTSQGEPGFDSGAVLGCPQFRTDVENRRAIPVEDLWADTDFEPGQIEISDDGTMMFTTRRDIDEEATESSLYRAPIGTSDWLPFSSLQGRMDTILAIDGALFVSGDHTGLETQTLPIYRVALDGGVASAASDADGAGIIRLAQDPSNPANIIAGSRWGSLFQYTGADHWALRSVGTNGAHISSIEFIESDVYVGTGNDNQWLESTDTGSSFALRGVTEGRPDFGGGISAITRYGSETEALLVYVRDAGVFACSEPATGSPMALGNSAQIYGRDVHVPRGNDEGIVGAHLLVTEGVIVVGTESELWYSDDDGETFFLIENLLDCVEENGRIHDVTSHDGFIYVATSLGVRRFAIASL